jgi:hypothetical protein
MTIEGLDRPEADSLSNDQGVEGSDSHDRSPGRPLLWPTTVKSTGPPSTYVTFCVSDSRCRAVTMIDR